MGNHGPESGGKDLGGGGGQLFLKNPVLSNGGKNFQTLMGFWHVTCCDGIGSG